MFDQLEALIFDFDGVLTDDRVWVDQSGREMVCCNRRDGLAFDVLRKHEIKMYILSTETNPVVLKRGKKIKIQVHHCSKDKLASLAKLAESQKFSLKNTFYIGNDVNDYFAMKACGYSACPADSHSKIKDIAMFPLKTKGGHGVVRELVESVFRLDMMSVLFNPSLKELNL